MEWGIVLTPDPALAFENGRNLIEHH